MNLPVICLHGEYQGVAWNNFLLSAESIEELFDTVSSHVARGLQLKEVKAWQVDRWINWPVDLFNGQSLQNQTQQLQHEWETILSPALQTRQIHQQRQATFDRQVCYYEQQVHWASSQLARLEQARQQAEALSDAQLRIWNLNRLAALQQSHELMKSQLQIAQQRALDFRQTLAG